ncbi:hypothetical protein HSRCO_2251 [Halanaeroarchaeum sp. HSR-CO]|nr:hypothetical protein HSRCO_2251 [Halanaeroarchaeum sp. HSR-CO]
MGIDVACLPDHPPAAGRVVRSEVARRVVRSEGIFPARTRRSINTVDPTTESCAD